MVLKAQNYYTFISSTKRNYCELTSKNLAVIIKDKRSKRGMFGYILYPGIQADVESKISNRSKATSLVSFAATFTNGQSADELIDTDPVYQSPVVEAVIEDNPFAQLTNQQTWKC